MSSVAGANRHNQAGHAAVLVLVSAALGALMKCPAMTGAQQTRDQPLLLLSGISEAVGRSTHTLEVM